MLCSLRRLLSVFPKAHSRIAPVRRDLPKSVALFLYGGFGDTVMKLAAVRNLPADIEIQLVASRKHEPLLDLVSGKNIKRFVIRSVGDLFSIRTKINRESLFLFQSPLIEIYLIYLALGFSCAYGFVGDRSVYRAIGIKGAIPSPAVALNDYDNYRHMVALYVVSKTQRFKLLKKEINVGVADYVVININKSQGWPAGRWSAENFLQVAEFICRELNLCVVLVGSRNEAEHVGKFEMELRRKTASQIVNISGKTNFEELVWVVSKARFVLTCDAFIMHLASYVNVPIFSIFSFSDPHEFVWGNNTFSFNPEFPCMPCVSFTTAPVDNAPFYCPHGARCDSTVSANEMIHKIRAKFLESHRPLS